MGTAIYNCSCLAADLGKIFEAYWFLGDSQSVPSTWPDRFTTLYNKDTPLQLPLNNTPSRVYLSVRSLCFYDTNCMKPGAGVFLLLVHYTHKKHHICFPFHSEFPSILVCSWQDSRPPVHPQRHGGRPELYLHCCHELSAHNGVLTP